MRARNIKPGFFTNEDLAEVSIPARYLFAGLWCMADREGRLEDRPKRIKGEIFRFDSIETEPLLKELSAFHFIIRYEVDGRKFIWIPKFSSHQSPHYQEKPSIIPPSQQEKSFIDDNKNPGKSFDDDNENPGKSFDDDSENPEQTPEKSFLKRGVISPDSLIPDSLIPDSQIQKRDSAKKPPHSTSPSLDLPKMWATLCPSLPQIRELTRKRTEKINLRITEHPDPAFWAEVFRLIEISSFCKGENDRGWKASMDWIIDNQDNAIKVLEGKYSFTRSTATRKKTLAEQVDEACRLHVEQEQRDPPGTFNSGREVVDAY